MKNVKRFYKKSEMKERMKELVAEVEKMDDGEFKAMLKAKMSSVYHSYSLLNLLTILILSGETKAAGYKKWKELGRTVKGGESAIWILAPVFAKKKDKEAVDPAIKPQRFVIGFRSVPVFTISQTDIVDEEVWAKVEADENKGMTESIGSLDSDKLIAVVGKLGYSIDYRELRGSCGGYISDKSIVLNSLLSKEDNTGTLLHEVAHGELGHKASHDLSARSLHEQEAESVAYLIGCKFGVDRNSSFYLKSWGLSDNIQQSLSKIEKVTNKILKMLEA